MNSLKFAVQDKLLPGTTYKEKIKICAESGFDCYEISPSADIQLIDRVDEINAASDNAGIYPETVCGGYRGFIGHLDKELRETSISDIKMLINAIELIGASAIILPAAYGVFSKKLPPFIPPRTEEQDRKILYESLTLLGEYAGEKNIKIYVEPLNRYEDHMINTVSDAVSIVEMINLKNVRVMLDVFHGNIEEDNIIETIIEFSDWIEHVHLADSNRFQPGCGHLDFNSILGALKTTGFSGICALECSFKNPGSKSLMDVVRLLKNEAV